MITEVIIPSVIVSIMAKRKDEGTTKNAAEIKALEAEIRSSCSVNCALVLPMTV